MNDRGKYIVIEGVDGAGKTTQTKRIADALMAAGMPVLMTFDPGDTVVGDLLRKTAFDPSIEMSNETIIDLFSAARRESIRQVVQPALKAGKTVVSDRNWYSLIPYQGFGSGGDIDYIIQRSKDATGDFFKPDAVVILDLDPELAISRRTVRKETDRFELKDPEFFKKVRDGYHWVAKHYGATIIDASQPVETVEKLILEAISDTVGL
jgi:dTMP kinase